MNSSGTSGKGPILAFVAIVLVSAIVGVAFYLSKLADRQEQIAPAEPGPDQPGIEAGSGEEMAADPGSPKTEDLTAKPTQPAMIDKPSSPAPDKPGEGGKPVMEDADLVADLTEKLSKGDMEGFAETAGKLVATPEKMKVLEKLLKEHHFTIHPEKPQQELIVPDEKGKRWSINLAPPEDLARAGVQQIRIELEFDPETGWSVAGMELPDIEPLLAKMEKTPEETGMKGDPVNVATTFVDAVVARQFELARDLVSSDHVSDEKLAALFIVVEDGEFKMNEEKPLIATMAQEKTAWVIARLVSGDGSSEFGIEMERPSADAPWKVVGLNLDQFMQAQAMKSGAGDVAYAPIRTDLKGGDSLVLYFEFDEDDVNVRVDKQLEIIASILKQDPTRKLHISGHADALGEEDYNESLSRRRATRIREALLANGVPPSQIVTTAYGETSPTAPNLKPDGSDNPYGRAQNRRAEVYLQF